jgi:hypothetical protein
LHLLAWVHWPSHMPGVLEALADGVTSTRVGPSSERRGSITAVA